jgi:hypothetical protein
VRAVLGDVARHIGAVEGGVVAHKLEPSRRG